MSKHLFSRKVSINQLMKNFLVVAIVLFSVPSYAQIVDLGTDHALCSENDSVQIVGVNIDSSRIMELWSPTVLSLSDDNFSPVVNIGFPFVFYDSTYTQLLIGSNGLVSFNVSSPLGFCPYYFNDTIPYSNSPNNVIMAPWMDLSPQSSQSSVVYERIGTAPNRRFVIFYNNPALYNCGFFCMSSAIVLHESTNEIEIFLKDKPTGIGCWSSNNQRAVEGIVNQDGSVAHIVPGRNYPSVWSTNLDGKKWTPNGPQSYLLEDVPFNVVVTDGPFTIEWGNTLQDSIPMTDTLNAYWSATGDVGYFKGVKAQSNCNGTMTEIIPLTDTTWILQDFHPELVQIQNDFCLSNNGFIESTDSTTTDSSYYWIDQMVYADSLMNLGAGFYPYTYTGNNGCQLTDTLEVMNQDTLDAQVSVLNCQGDTDGTIQIIPYYPFINYNWTLTGIPDSSNINNLSEGLYECDIESSIGCSHTITAIIAPIPPVHTINLALMNELCFDQNNGSYSFDIIDGVPPYSIQWNTSPTNQTSFDSLAPGNYPLSIVDSNGCVFEEMIEILEVDQAVGQSVVISSETLGNDGSVTIYPTGGTPPYSYSLGGTPQSGSQFDNLSSGQYTSTLTDANGCVNTISFYLNSTVGEVEISSSSWLLYPNPTEGYLTLIGNELLHDVQIYVFDTKGQLLIEQATNDSTFSFGLPEVAGIYLVEVRVDDEVQVYRIVKN